MGFGFRTWGLGFRELGLGLVRLFGPSRFLDGVPLYKGSIRYHRGFGRVP